MGGSMNVLSGTLELLVLQTLGNGAQLHGFEVLDAIRNATGEALVIEEGALYPALHRLEKKGMIEAEWGQTELNRQGKFYSLTEAGRAALSTEQERWRAYARAVEAVLEVFRSEGFAHAAVVGEMVAAAAEVAVA